MAEISMSKEIYDSQFNMAHQAICIDDGRAMQYRDVDSVVHADTTQAMFDLSSKVSCLVFKVNSPEIAEAAKLY